MMWNYASLGLTLRRHPLALASASACQEAAADGPAAARCAERAVGASLRHRDAAPSA